MKFLWLPREEIATDDETFRVRRRYPEPLRHSVTQHGVKTPLLVLPVGSGFQLVSGWGRYEFAPRDSALPAYVLPAQSQPETVWERFLTDNDRWNVVEVARVLDGLRSLDGMTDERIVREKLPLLGVRPANDLYRGHLRLLELPAVALEFIEQENLPLRRASLFSKLPAGALPAFVEHAVGLRWTLNEIAEVLELVAETAEREQVAADEILRETCAGNEKAAALANLRERRYPELSRYQRELAELTRELRFTVPVKIEWDRRLERPGIRLIADLEDADALRTLRTEMEAQSDKLRGFFDIL